MIEELKELVDAIEEERHAVEKMAEYIQSSNELMTKMWEKKMDDSTKRLDLALEAAKEIIKIFPANTNILVN